MILAFMNMKGGVGKTTLCVHLAGAAAAELKRVLVIDYDPQYNATQHLITDPKEYFELVSKNKTVYGILQPSKGMPNPFNVIVDDDSILAPSVKEIVYPLFKVGNSEPYGAVDLIPGSDEMMHLVLGKSDKTTKPMETRFHNFLLKAEKKYDYIFIDCHPAGSFLTRTALVMADLIVVPVVPDSYSQRGVILMKDFIEYLRKFSKRDLKMKIVFNKTPYYRGDNSEELSIRNHVEFEDKCLKSSLHDSSAITKAGRVKGYTWKRMMQWSRKPWSARIRADLSRIFEELIGEQPV
jgi:chromosome partitioning protein